MIEIYFDGSCDKNPHGRMGYGFHINLHGTEIDCGYSGCAAKHGNTNNIAEYRALMMALELFKDTKGKTIHVRGDSDLVIKQMNGEYRIKKGAYKEDALKCRELVSKLRQSNQVSFKWIPRDQNERADELSNQYYKK